MSITYYLNKFQNRLEGLTRHFPKDAVLGCAISATLSFGAGALMSQGNLITNVAAGARSAILATTASLVHTSATFLLRIAAAKKWIPAHPHIPPHIPHYVFLGGLASSYLVGTRLGIPINVAWTLGCSVGFYGCVHLTRQTKPDTPWFVTIAF